MRWRRPFSVAAGVTLLLAVSTLAWSGSAWSDATSGRSAARVAVPAAAKAGPVEVVAPTSGAIPLGSALVSDRSGTSTVVWAEGCTLRAARRGPSGGWSKTEVVSRGTSSQECWNPRAGVDGTGRVTVVWTRVVRGQRFDVLVATRTRAGGWSRVVELTRGRGYRQGYEAQVRVAASGATLVTWQRVNGDGADFARLGPRAPASRWLRVRPHHLPALPADLMDTAVANNGTAMVVGYDASGGSSVLYERRFVPGKGWAPALRVGNGVPGRLVMNARGAGLFVYSGGRGQNFWYATKVRRISRTGHWWPARRLSRFSEDESTTAVIGPKRQVTVAWEHAGVTHTMSQARPGGRWKGATLGGLTRNDGLDARLQAPLVQNQRGDQALLWARWGTKTASSRIAMRRHNGRWSAARLIGLTGCTTGRGATCSPTALTVLPNGTSLTVWVDLEHRLVSRTLTP